MLCFCVPLADYACASMPCAQGGTCRERGGAFTCNCASGWTGHTCNISKCRKIK